jgi:hypothetical protein
MRARKRRPQAGPPDAGADAFARGGRGRLGGASRGCRCLVGDGPRHGVWLAGPLPGGRQGGVEGPAGAGAATEVDRRADAPAVHDDRGGRPAAVRVRVRAVDPGDGPHADPPRVSGVAVGGQRRSAAAHAGPVAPTTAVAGLAGRPRGSTTMEGRTVPGDPRAGQGRRCHGVFRRRGRAPLGLPRGHHLGPRSDRLRWSRPPGPGTA